jgi:hypothetical protein
MSSIWNILALITLLVVATMPSNAANTFTFEFDNADNPGFDFVGTQMETLTVLFSQEGPGMLNEDDTFSLSIGSAPGANNLFSAPLLGPFGFEAGGLIFSSLEGAIPQTDTFFLTLETLSGVLNVTDVTATFPIVLANGATVLEEFSGNRIRNISAVPEPATWLMMIIGFAFTGFSLRRRRKFRNSLA